jgi:putative oxidoreductase
MLYLIAKILLGSLFLLSGLYGTLFDSNKFLNTIEVKHMPYPAIVAIFVLSYKILLGSILIFSENKKKIKQSSILLILFTFVATMMYHNAFFDMTQLENMLKNFAIIGGLLLLIK